MEIENKSSFTEFGRTTETDDRGGALLENAPTTHGNSTLESDADNSWEHQLNTFKLKIEELQERYEQSYLEIGRLLIQARDVYKGHGDWIKWLKANAPFSVRHAQRLIRVAEMFDDATMVSRLRLTSSKAYILTRLDKKDMNNFLESDHFFRIGDNPKSVKDMTKRELELAVTIHLKGKLTSTDHEEVTSSIQDKENLKDRVESNLEELRKILNKTIISIKGSDSDTRASWISELDDLYKTSLDQLSSVAE